MFTAIVLAGGLSRRMGRPKQQLVYQGRTMLRHVVENLLLSSVERIIVVLGYEADAAAASLTNLPITLVCNPDFATGLSSSLRRGLSALAAEVESGKKPVALDGPEAVLFALGDQPLIKPDTYAAILAAHQVGKIIVPYYAGQRGNPVLIDRLFLPELAHLQGDVGARALLRLHPEAVLPIELDDKGIVQDIDTWQDYQLLLDEQ
ncbi:MAG: nucleotidyltransferase family protein [Peptococcaceae bacterium]|nr:nucleotidyltransferase family protein [Peptococcaceae bacterium]